MHDRQNEGYKVDFETKLAIIQVVIAAIVAMSDDSSLKPSQIDTKIEIFKKDLRNWLKLITKMSSFNKYSKTRAIVAFEDQWNQLLSISFNKDAYERFRNKSLANKKLLSILFFDTLIIGAHVRTSYDIVVKKIVTKNDEYLDVERKLVEKRLKEKEQEKNLHVRLTLELEKTQNEL